MAQAICCRVRTVGNPMQIFERIRRVVFSYRNKPSMIPVVKFERKLQRGSRGQFYVLLAVENKEGMTLPDEVATVLEYAGLRGQPLWPIDPAAVKVNDRWERNLKPTASMRSNMNLYGLVMWVIHLTYPMHHPMKKT